LEIPAPRVQEVFQAATEILVHQDLTVILDLLDRKVLLDLGEAREILVVLQDPGAMLAVPVSLAVLAILAISAVQVM
jgi:hypothetical protein